jgi:hypothetical protein
MYWSDSSGYITLKITKAQVRYGYHQGQCDESIAALRAEPSIKKQLDALDPELVKKILYEYSDWDLSNHEDNLDRLLWIACGDIYEGLDG